jgi:phage tail tape-measure protein
MAMMDETHAMMMMVDQHAMFGQDVSALVVD